MQPSSLIFVLIVVIWAAYLLQHWIRRREALVTARTVDQFSEAMRVLEHRGASEASGEPARRVSTSSSARSLPSRVSSPLPRTSLRAGSVMTGEEPLSPSPRQDTAPPQRDTTPDAEPDSAPVRVGSRVIRGLAGLNSRRVRGIAFVVSLALLLAAVVLAPVGLLPWWSPMAGLVLAGAVFTWLRREAIVEQRARQETRPARRAPRVADQAPATRPVSGPQVGQASAAPAPTRTPLPPRDTVFDHARPAETPQAKPAPAAEPVEGGWSPVPVPPPTYTMKERADRPAPEPAPAETVARSHQDTPVDELPFDGLALDQDLEELPSIHRAG